MLTAEWMALLERYPQRFPLGSDTRIDERWDGYASIMGAHRAWLAQLRREVAEKIGHGNAGRPFRR